MQARKRESGYPAGKRPDLIGAPASEMESVPREAI